MIKEREIPRKGVVFVLTHEFVMNLYKKEENSDNEDDDC